MVRARARRPLVSARPSQSHNAVIGHCARALRTSEVGTGSVVAAQRNWASSKKVTATRIPGAALPAHHRAPLTAEVTSATVCRWGSHPVHSRLMLSLGHRSEG